MSDARRPTIELDRPEAWLSDLLDVLTTNRDALRSREKGPLSDRYDAAVYAVVEALEPYSVVGWHCTRLADHEVEDIRANGMALLDVDLVSRRIDAAIRHELISSNHGARLKAVNQAAERYRAGMLWFCFFTPARAGEGGIGDLLRYWGGEAVYNSHDRHPEMGKVIAGVGRPAIVEAEIPVAWCGRDRGLRLAMNIGQRYVIAQGTRSPNSTDVEDNIKRPLPAELVRAVHVFPAPEFLTLSGCSDWHHPL
ncbi:hypothetical protein LB557_04585 [Mesorhizobium sp. BR115XR7A]|uniref:hypothetical protein n=2 Tax=unclassified Mesorhizobium TaxID=325217 RepID=UPI001CC99F49|nr:hypothetical protein [Mesorhizobium sp. BR115XR7A]MBZ9905289.1 hypothetical protein [Mesorhizobium sp. BR115XR7A]MBZ9930361.1 hypothetical protein [Mesorhizobium sp. BR1-1-5]